MDQQSYTVTEKAGPKVAGRRVAPGDTLMLTPAAAEYWLGQGAIVATASNPAPASKSRSKAD